MEKTICVIGGGIAGLTAAALLARHGNRVTLFEKNASVGGKMALLERDGFSWDMGPSLLTMPHVLRELWETCGRRIEEDLDLVRLESTCRYRWTDGTAIDEDATFWRRPDVAAFLNYARGLWRVSEQPFLRHDIADPRGWMHPQTLKAFLAFFSVAAPATLADKVHRAFRDPHIRQIFLRFATYNGSSPYKTPAAFNIIPFVQAEFGGWYVRGGMHRIAENLAALAQRLGVEIRTATPVACVNPRGRRNGTDGWKIVTDAGEEAVFDAVVCNQDVLSAHEQLLPERLRQRFRRTHLSRLPLSTSGFAMFLGLEGTTPQLDHHNIFFSDDYPREFHELFKQKKPAADPTIYIALNSRTDPSRAPVGCENWFVLVNAPAAVPDVDWAEFAPGYCDAICGILEKRFGLGAIQSRIRVRKFLTPADFERRHLALGGALYGFASHGLLTAFRRPPIAPRGLHNFVFAGGTTHPGGGVPLAVLSGCIAAAKLGSHEL